MRNRNIVIAVLLILSGAAMAAADPTPAEKYWGQWRGPEANGVAPHADPPLSWSESENVAWKVPIPGRGLSTPIVWGDRIFVQTAVPAGGGEVPSLPEGAERSFPPTVTTDGAQDFVVMALAREDGRVLWQQTAVTSKPHEGFHTDASWASASPVTDGEHVWVHFGSRGTYCYTVDGELVWSKDLGDMRTRHAFGEGSSPTLWGDHLIVNWDHEGDSFLVVLDKRTGEERWRAERPGEVTSWSTPLVVDEGGEPQIVIASTGKSRGYDLATGKVLWEADGMTVNTIPSPVYADGLVYLTSGFRGSLLQAVRLAEAKGEITDSKAIVWSHDRDTPYVPSPLLYGDGLYFLKVNTGILTRLDPKTGETDYLERLDDVTGVYSSPVGAAGRVYVVGRNGVTQVLRNSETYEVLATNTLDDRFDASPAVVGGEIYLRGHQHLYALKKK